MKKFLTSLLSILGITGIAAEPKVATVDPKKILFSVPTLSDDLGPVEAIKEKPTASDFVLNEDDWSQIEFLSKDRVEDIQRILKEYKAFEAMNRAKVGWRNVYVRKFQRHPLLKGPQALDRLGSLLKNKPGPAPILVSGQSVTGSIKGGFSLPLGGNVELYGYSTNEGIPILAARVGKDPDDSKLVAAFQQLNAAEGLVLVDWVQQFILISMEHEKVSLWRP